MTGQFAPERLALGAVAEGQLLEAARRLARQDPALSAGRVALVLHLAALRPPAPRPHHRRIARAILEDAAQRHGGQVFALRNGDIVLLAREAALHDPALGPGPPAAPVPARAAAPPAATPADGGPLAPTLPDALSRLLRIDAHDPARLVSVWSLARDHVRLVAYAAARAEERLANPPAEEEFAMPLGLMDEIGTIIATPRIDDLLQRQTAAQIGPDVGAGGWAAPAGGAAALRPLFREVMFSIAALEARLPAEGHAASDPFLFRHMVSQLDRRMLELVPGELGRGGPLDLSIAARGAPPLHLNLTLEAILSPSFAAFAASCRDAGVAAGIEVSFIEACADSRSFAAARAAVAAASMALVLDGVSHLALLLAHPWSLKADLLKLDWSPRLGELPPSDERDIAAAIAAAGAHRIVLQRAESEAAVRWGMASAIRRFQGRHVDAMLAASRIMACPMAAGCVLRQCIERAGAVGPASRAACGNLQLLDAATPPPRPASPSAGAAMELLRPVRRNSPLAAASSSP